MDNLTDEEIDVVVCWQMIIIWHFDKEHFDISDIARNFSMSMSGWGTLFRDAIDTFKMVGMAMTEFTTYCISGLIVESNRGRHA